MSNICNYKEGENCQCDEYSQGHGSGDQHIFRSLKHANSPQKVAGTASESKQCNVIDRIPACYLVETKKTHGQGHSHSQARPIEPFLFYHKTLNTCVTLVILELTRKDHGEKNESKCDEQLSCKNSVYLNDELLSVCFPFETWYAIQTKSISADTFLDFIFFNLSKNFKWYTFRIHRIQGSLVQTLSE